MSYRQLHFKLRFLTPAFLGDAEQNGRWRTPPIKAQLRQWWRFAYAADKRFVVNVDEMRREEGLLFGNAWIEDESCRSQVRLRLSHWNEGSLKKTQWPRDAAVDHPNVKQPVGSALYLGYGPLVFDNTKRATGLKANAAIQEEETSELGVAVPERTAGLIVHALALMDRYGTLGSRSRNGWGSFELHPIRDTEALAGETPTRDWKRCLDLDWPHALAADGPQGDTTPLIWRTEPFGHWCELMQRMARLKIGLRTQFSFTHGKDAPGPEPRHWLSYPVTRHNVSTWRARGAGDFRLPNCLRFKVRPAADGKIVGVIFHVPHRPPPDFSPDRSAIERVWEQVHRFLDQPAQGLERISA